MINDKNNLWTRRGLTLALASMATGRRLGERLRQICDTDCANKDNIDEEREGENEKEESGEFRFHYRRHSFLRIGAFEGVEQGRDCSHAKLLLR